MNYLAAIILFAAIIIVLCLFYKFFSNNTASFKPSNITIIYKSDSLQNKHYNDTQLKKLDSIMNLLTIKHELIDKKQEILLQSQSNDTFLNKIFTALIAFVLAIAGFFGFKSINEIKTQAIEEAVEASRIASVTASQAEAKLEFEKVFTKEYKAEVYEISASATNKFIREEIDSIHDEIVAINSKLNNSNPTNAENEVQVDSKNEDANNQEVIDPFQD